MNVEVIIEVSAPPTRKNLKSLKAAAAKLTNKKSSINVRTTEKDHEQSASGGQHIAIITQFTMKTTAQSKVIDHIYKAFKFWIFDIKDYQDMSISFPKASR